ncbi:MAG: response regulator, partial [Pseudomonadota bacterium]
MAPTILCIEDSKTIQKAVEIAFAYEGFQVVPALTPAEGLQKAQQLQPALVLLDTSLPGANAYELCQSLRQNPSTASVPVIMLAGTVEAFDQAKAQSVGCTDHLPKPFETKVLIEKARTLTGIAAQPVAAAPAVAPPLPTPPAPAAPALAPVAPRPPAPPAMPAIAPPAP